MANHASASDWDWTVNPDIPVGFLMFAQDMSPQQIISEFGIDPDTGRILPLDQVNESISIPTLNEAAEVIHPWLRSGMTGDWTFAIDQNGIDVFEYEPAARNLSQSTSLAMIAWTSSIDNFYYWENGNQVCSFEPGMWWERYGSDPDLFLPQMTSLGLQVVAPTPGQPSNEEVSRWASPVIPALEILTLAFGIRVPAAVASGPLLTAQRT